ncbi:MAG TPA: TetR/AcrR family transcriptional regulator [Candidatus Dormibacteraeota bacterium]|nr:TetR/AcrR family transcriptional regulator [Candidatus Dormibacteraeota bacterium]
MGAREATRTDVPRANYTTQSLLAVAVEVFNLRGYDGTSMEDLAQACGITKSSIYHHVRSKEELLRLAVSRALDMLNAVLEEAETREGRAIDRLEHMVRGSIRVVVEELPYVTLLLRVRGNTRAEQWALQRRREFDNRLSQIVGEAAADGDLRDDLDPRLTTRLLFGMVNSMVEWYSPSRGGSSVDLADSVMRLALDGLRRRDPQG